MGDLSNPAVPTFDRASGLYPLFLGGFENQCQQYNVLGSELGARVFPVEGLDLYANATLMNIQQDNSNCSALQLSLIAPDSRTADFAMNAGAQLRTKLGIDGSIDFHYEAPTTWAEQVVDLTRQQIVYQSFPLSDYEIVNVSVGYHFLANKADLRGTIFNLFDDEHREHPFGQVVGRRAMGMFSYKF